MKASEIRSLDGGELDAKLKDLEEAYFNLKFQHRTGQLESPSRLGEVKRDIARVKTIMREKDLNIR